VIRVLLADDQALVRGGFRLILDSAGDIEVVAEAADGDEAIAQCREHRPDVALLDIRMPGVDGLDAAKTILADGSCGKVLMLTTFHVDDYIYEALRLGASGYLLKDVDPPDLVAAVRAAYDGELPFASAITRHLVEHYLGRGQRPRRDDPRLAQLTAREREVLAAVARGRTNAEIADELVVSLSTVKTHVTSILTKLGLRDRIQAVILAYEAGVVSVGATD
jgi:DNA-binding NarL/FixJ family response regulator